MSTHSLCFELKYEKYQNFLSENCPLLVVKFSIYLNRRVFVMDWLRAILNRFLYIDKSPGQKSWNYFLYINF